MFWIAIMSTLKCRLYSWHERCLIFALILILLFGVLLAWDLEWGAVRDIQESEGLGPRASRGCRDTGLRRIDFFIQGLVL